MKYDLDQAYRHLRKDPVMKQIIRKTGKLDHVSGRDLYIALLQSITSQQLSTKAGDTIYNRFLDLFPQRKPHPHLLIELDTEKMRLAGMSYAKASYLKNIAVFSMEQGLDYRKLCKLDDAALMTHLTTIKGVGRWTSEMILMFSLNRPDVLPVDDVVIRNEMKRHYNLRGDGKKLIAAMERTAESWRPYRSLACRHLWRFRDS